MDDEPCRLTSEAAATEFAHECADPAGGSMVAGVHSQAAAAHALALEFDAPGQFIRRALNLGQPFARGK